MGASGDLDVPGTLAEPSDVKDLINTSLEDEKITSFLSDATRDITRENGELADTLRKDLEKYLASYRIRGFRDRGLASGTRDSTKLKYDGSALDELRRQVELLDPSGNLVDSKDEGRVRRRSMSFGSATPYGHSDARRGICDEDPMPNG